MIAIMTDVTRTIKTEIMKATKITTEVKKITTPEVMIIIKI